MNVIRFLVLATLICAGGSAHAATFSGKVIAVMDGDTLLVLKGKQPTKVRLAGIDAPEVGHAGMGGMPPNSQKAQPYGAASQQSLADMVMGKQVRVTSRAVDSYGRLVATVRADGLDVNSEQVRRGMAWDYSRSRGSRGLAALQREARQARRGLWADEGAIEPSQWRKQHPVAARPHAPTAAAPGNSCGNKKRCSEMSSCGEAQHYLTRCGIKALDGNGDGAPCEDLCGGEKHPIAGAPLKN